MKKTHIKELERIQASLPEDIKNNLFITRSVNPTIKEVFEKAADDETNSEEIRQKAKDVLLSGALDATETVPNEEYTQKANEYFEKEIDRAIKLGRLPKHIKGNTNKKLWKTSKKSQEKTQ